MSAGPVRVRARVEGTVQGVGFRPFVFRLAREEGVSGWVLNDARGVLLEAEAARPALERFLARLASDAPPLADVERVSREELAPARETGFRIVESAARGTADALVSPDMATCPACVSELFDPADRRFRYPFTNCTNCGPRFTILRSVPYDRPRTTMAGFAMCPACRAEYEDPTDRRFHAQPNACPTCGPRTRLAGADGRELEPGTARDAIAGAALALRAGRIVAVKGLGGYHLACPAADAEAVGALRARKHREDKPFALMVPDVEAATALVELAPEARALLESGARPIVLAPRRADAAVAPAVAPGAPELGVMLPYTPLHHLLVADLGEPLVLTSGNVSDEPIAYEDADALARLAPIADAFLLHDRPIHMRTDDSVARAVQTGRGRRPLLLRRSRGYVPAALGLPEPATRPVLACGAQLKSTFCLARGERAWVGHHVGDLSNWETLSSFRAGVEHFESLFAVAPEVVAHDLHPDYLSTAYALERAGVEHVAVQHHHAHLAACLAEHGETGPALGAMFDGTGLGDDGTIWGGELLVGSPAGFARVGRLHPVRMPGGERAIREPWRMACAWLVASGRSEPALPPALSGRVDPERWRAVARLAASGFASPQTTSAGRLFDAVAALCGVRAEVTYEGQAAVELEARADPAVRGGYPLPVVEGDGLLELDARATVLAVLADASAGVPAGTISARFHAAVAAATVEACVLLAGRHDLGTVALSGGVFQNRRLLEAVAGGLVTMGLRVLVPERLPPNDAQIAYGQAVVAAAR